MKFPSTLLKQISVETGKRILVTSDIHGYLSYFQNVLKKADFCDNDILIIVGDVLEKGPDSLGTLRYIMKLCERGNVLPLIGNVDAYRLKLIYELCEKNVTKFYNYLLKLRARQGTSFYDELARECGYTVNSAEDILLSKRDVIEHFEREFDFVASLPTIVETQNYVFVHGGLCEKRAEDNQSKDLFELTKYDAFMSVTSHVFDKYVVVGHWPVSLYSTTIQQLNPIINREKKIISIDGGCGVKDECQINLLIIPDINCSIDEVSHLSYDSLPAIRALNAQKPSSDSIHICWTNREIQMINRGDDFSYIEHKQSGRKLYVPNSYLINDTECYDYTDYMLPVEKGERLSLITETSRGCIVKKNGIIGWYCGEYEADDMG